MKIRRILSQDELHVDISKLTPELPESAGELWLAAVDRHAIERRAELAHR